VQEGALWLLEELCEDIKSERDSDLPEMPAGQASRKRVVQMGIYTITGQFTPCFA